MQLSVKLEGVGKAIADLKDFQSRQLPFVLAKSLTDTAKDAQAAVQASLTEVSRFELRNNWTRQGIRIKPAVKTAAGGRIEADVHTDLSRNGSDDYLARQEEDYTRVPVGGHQYLCVPTDTLRRMAGGKNALIPDDLRPSNLLRYADGKFKYAVTKGKMKGALRSVSRASPIRGMVFFTDSNGVPLKTRSGARGIWGRTVGDPRQAYLLYVMVRQTRSVRRRFFMEEIVTDSAEQNFAKNWEKNWNDLFAKGFRV